MIRHIFTTDVKEETTSQEIDEFIKQLSLALTDKVPGMIDFHVGRNLEYYDRKAKIVVVADLKDKEAYETYITFPDHLKVGEKYGYIFKEDTMYASQIEI